MLLFICLEVWIGGGWDGSSKEAWVFGERFGGDSCVTDTDIIWSDIVFFPDTDVRCCLFFGKYWNMKES